MSDELSFFRLMLFACLEAGVLAMPSFRDSMHALTFAALFGLALVLQWLIHDEGSLRMADPLRTTSPDELERVFFAGNELETEVEVSAENATLRDALGAAQQLKVRLGMVAVFGLFLFVVLRGHLSVEMAMLFPVLAALAIVPAMSLNHFIPPLAAATFGVLSGALKPRLMDAESSPTADLVYRAVFVFLLTVAIWAYRRVELSLRETEPTSLTTRGRRNWALPAQAAAVFLLLWNAFNAITPHFDATKAPPKAAPPLTKAETQALQFLLKRMTKPTRPGSGSAGQSGVSGQTGTESGAGSQSSADAQAAAGSALAGLNPEQVSAALALAQAMSRYTPPSGGPHEGKDALLPKSGSGADAQLPRGGVPENRAQAEALLKQMAEMANGKPGAPAGLSAPQSGTPSAASAPQAAAAPPQVGAPASHAGAAVPPLPTNDADFQRTLAAAKELARGMSGPESDAALGSLSANPAATGSPGQASSPMNGATPGTQAQGAKANGPPGNPAQNPARASNQTSTDPTTGAAEDARKPVEAPRKIFPPISESTLRFLERLGRLALTLAIAGLILAFLRKLLMAPRAQGDAKKRRAPRRLRQLIQRELSRINRTTLSPRQEVLARYQLFLRAAALREEPKEDWFPPTDFDHRLGEAFPPVASHSHFITDIFCETTYADRVPDPARLQTFRTACTEAIQTLLS